MNSERIDAILLQPPPGDITGPYPALAYLKSYAQQEGIHCVVYDLGIEALDYLSKKSRIKEATRKVKAVIAKYEGKPSLGKNKLNHLEQLYRAYGFSLNPSLIREAMLIFRDSNKFYNYTSYKKAVRILNAFYNFLSALHYPSVVSPSQYPSATELKNWNNVFLHCSKELNPFIQFYENVVFPKIAEAQPLVVGISMVFSNQSVQALVLGKLIKERFPSIHVTIGGAYLSQWVTILEEHQLASFFVCVDSIICGEGEIAFSKLVRTISRSQSLHHVPNIIYKDASKETIVRFDQLKYPDISELPAPNFDDLDLRKYLTPQIIIPYCISRGCYWGRCVFCQNRYGDQKIRAYQVVPVDKALRDLEELSKKYNSNHFNFNNDVIDPAYLKRFSKAVISSNKRFVWNTDLRAEKTFIADVCHLLHKAGLNSVAIGLESACQKTLDLMDKGPRVTTVKHILKNMYQAGIATHLMGIFGFPGESENEANKTIDFIRNNRKYISYYVVGLLMVLPGSRMYNNPQKYGVTEITFGDNDLKTPEPIWKSNNRISQRAAVRLYNRLEELEEVYEINEYPYVGGLATNHGFLYFARYGPGILKRLRVQEQARFKKHIHTLGLILKEDIPEEAKSYILKYNYPFAIVTSRHSLGRITSHHRNFGLCRSSRFLKKTYFIDAINPPFRMGPLELEIIRRIAEYENLRSILEGLPQNIRQHVAHLLFQLITTGSVLIKKTTDGPS